MISKHVGSKYDINLTTKEIARLIREQLKREFPMCKFSVRCKYFSLGSEITVSLMSAPFKVIKDFEEIPEEAIQLSGRPKEQIRELQAERYHQLNKHQLLGDYNPNEWCNGVYLTERGHNLLKRVVEIVLQYNKRESDIQADYFNTNFYFMLTLGKWGKPFAQATA